LEGSEREGGREVGRGRETEREREREREINAQYIEGKYNFIQCCKN
jgi:hypothetical protein